MAVHDRNNTPERKAYIKAYHAEHREEVAAAKRRYVEANPEKRRESTAAYREANREEIKGAYLANKAKVREKHSAYYRDNRERLRAQQKEYREANKDRINLAQKTRRYGISSRDFAGMAKAQDNRCAIRGTPFEVERPDIDHCHKTGAVRGLLCGECNRGLSCFRDNPKTLRAAIKYLADFDARYT